MLAAALASGELDSVLAALEVALQSYTESREFASTCPTCSLHLANMMVNYQYWKSEGEMGKESVSPEQSFFTSRPQVILLLHPTCGFVSHTTPHVYTHRSDVYTHHSDVYTHHSDVYTHHSDL